MKSLIVNCYTKAGEPINELSTYRLAEEITNRLTEIILEGLKNDGDSCQELDFKSTQRKAH